MCTQKTRISCRMRIQEIPAAWEVPETWEIPGSWEFPGREKFEAMRAGGNGNFPLNIPGALAAGSAPVDPCLPRDEAGWPCPSSGKGTAGLKVQDGVYKGKGRAVPSRAQTPPPFPRCARSPSPLPERRLERYRASSPMPEGCWERHHEESPLPITDEEAFVAFRL